MSEPEWLGPATDALKQVGLDEAADVLAKAPAQADLLERAIAHLEGWLRDQGPIFGSANLAPPWRDYLDLIAAHRGETPEATLARLSPPPPIRPADEDEDEDDDWQRRAAALARPQFGSPTAGVNCGPYRPPESDGFIVADEMHNRVVRAQRREAEAVEAFLRSNHADPAIHDHLIYPSDPVTEGRRLHVLVPKAEAPDGVRILPPSEAMARYPHFFI